MRATWVKWKDKTNEKSRPGLVRNSFILVGSSVALLAAAAYSAMPDAQSGPLEEARAEAAKVIRRALEEADVGAAQLADTGAQAARLLGADSLIAGDLLRIAEEARRPSADPAAVRQALLKTHATLTFQPLMEAELPRGFPAPGPLGEIRVKEYPSYRMAVSKSGGTAFWTLFRHIKRHEIAMTTPVEMDYGDAASEDPAEESMAFLYGNPEMGQAGTDGSVEVIDAEPVTVVSFGLTGSRSDAKIEEARDRLIAWVDKHSEYVIAGSLRVLGYNSPFVPRDRQYSEVQVPIRKIGESAGGSVQGVGSDSP